MNIILETIDSQEPCSSTLITQGRDNIGDVQSRYMGQSPTNSSNHSRDSQTGDLMNRPFEHESQDIVLQAVHNNHSENTLLKPVNGYAPYAQDTGKPLLRNSYEPPLHPNPVYEKLQQLELAEAQKAMPVYTINQSQPTILHERNQSGASVQRSLHHRSHSDENMQRYLVDQPTYAQRNIHGQTNGNTPKSVYETDISSGAIPHPKQIRELSSTYSQDGQVKNPYTGSPIPGKKAFRKSLLRQDEIHTIKEDPRMLDVDILVSFWQQVYIVIMIFIH